MIVWSKGLGKLRLPLDLAAATPRVTDNYLVMEGTIDQVCWDYAVRLSPEDLKSFLKLMADKRTARFLAERGGVLLPFLDGLIVMVPKLLFRMIFGAKKTALPAG